MTDCGNLFKICNNSINQQCIYGVFLLIFSIIFLLFNLMGFIKMTKIYKKLKFENLVLSSCFIQTLIIIFILLFNKEYCFDAFYFIQLMMIISILKNFIKLLFNIDNNNICLRFNIYMLYFINIFFLLFMLYIYFIYKEDSNFDKSKKYVQLIYRICYMIINVLLTIFGRKLLKLLKKKKKKSKSKNKNDKNRISNNSNNYNYSLFNNNSLNINISGINNSNLSNENNNNNRDSNFSKENNNDNYNNSNYSNNTSHKNSVIFNIYNTGFYITKRKQILLIISLNLACSIIQFIFNLFKNFILNFDENQEYEVIPKDTLSILFYYFFIFICIVNVIVNFFSFYWSNRETYEIDKPKLLTDGEFIRITKYSKNPEFLEKLINEQGNSNNESFYNFNYNKKNNSNDYDYESIDSDLIYNNNNKNNNLKRTFLERNKINENVKNEENFFPISETIEDEEINKNKKKRKSTMDYENRNSLQ